MNTTSNTGFARRIMAVIIASLTLFSLAACGGKTAGGFSSDSLCIVHNGTSYKVNEKADRLLKALGSPSNTISQTSCHYGENGDEYTYEYYFGRGDYSSVMAEHAGNDDYTNLARYADVLRIHTVPLKKGVDTLCDIDCYTAEFTTDKGITVGSSKEEVFKAYGDSYTDEGGGFFTYYDGEVLPGTPCLMFYMPDGKVEFFSVSAAINC